MLNSDKKTNERYFTGIGLLASLLLSLLILPLFEEMKAGRPVLISGYSLTLICAAIVARSSLRIFAIAFLSVALPAGFASMLVEWKWLFVTHCLAGSLFFWYVGGKILTKTLLSQQVDFDSVLKALSAYLLFGLAWALTYWAAYTINPDSLQSPQFQDAESSSEIVGEFSIFVYYSFVTMSTLGYGDIIPAGRITRTLAWMQSVTGQFYVAVGIAWLVSSLPKIYELPRNNANKD